MPRTFPSPSPIGHLCASCLMAAAHFDGVRPSDPAPTLDEPPPRRLGDYELLHELARGGMGVVWLAVQRSLGRQVAVKLLPTRLASDPSRLARFRAEANLAARLQHANIVAIHEIGDDQGIPFFSMDYVPGQDLGSLARGRPLPPREAAELVRTVAIAIQYAHDQGVLHRDLKPSNVLVGSDGVPRVTDFGLAKLLDPESDLTLTGEILGSPCFMAPEQVSGRRRRTGVRTDVYGLGGILYYALTGRPPYDGESISATLQNVLHGTLVPPRTLQPSIPVEIEEIVVRCLARDPRQRFETASQLAAELERALRGQPLRIRAPGVWARAWAWVRREPGMAVLGTVCLLLAGALVVAGVHLAHHQETSRALAEQHRSAAEVNQYIADVSLAGRALAEGDIRSAVRLLDGIPEGRGPADRRGFEWYLLRQKCAGAGGAILWQGTEPVLDVVLTPDLVRVVLAGPASLRVLPARGALVERQYPLPAGARIRRVEVDPSLNHAWVGDDFGLHRVDLGSGEIDTLHPGPVHDLALDPRRGRVAFTLGSPGQDHDDVVILKRDNARTVARFAASGGILLDWASDGSLRYGRRDGTCWAWSEKGGIRTLPAFRSEAGIVAATESADLRRRAWVDGQGILRIEDLRSGRIEREERLARWHRVRLRFAPEGTRLVQAGGEDQRVILREAPVWSMVGQLHGHIDRISQVRILPDGQGVVTASHDRSVRRWAWEGAEVVPDWQDRPVDLPPREPVFSQDGEWMAVGFGDGERCSTRLWRTRHPDHPPQQLPGRTLALSPDGQVALQWLGRGRLELRSLQGRVRRQAFRVNPRPGPYPDQIPADGGYFASLGSDDRLRLHHAVSGQEIPGPVATIRRFILSPDGHWILFATPGGAGLFEPGERDQFHIATGEVASLAFSQDSRFAFVGQGSGHMVVYDVQERRVVADVDAQAGPIPAAAFLADNRSLVLAAEDGSVRFWNVPAWREIARLQLPGPVSGLVSRPDLRGFVTIGPSGLRLLSTGPDLPARAPVRVQGGFWEDPFGHAARWEARHGGPSPPEAAPSQPSTPSTTSPATSVSRKSRPM